MLITRPVYFKKLDPKAQVPQRAHASAGYDLFAIQRDMIPPGHTVMIPLGFATDIPPGVVGLIWDRSSMGNMGLKVMGGVIDSDYRGEWKVMLCNVGQSSQPIVPGQKVAQVIFQEFGQFELREVEHLSETERGTGGFGSTGR
jgi:dUTP pyrophosphatase